jgi:predicted phage terminase large subunit-like protein
VEITLPPLHRGQLTIAHHPARFKVVACGRRWGKTRLGVTMCLATAIQHKAAWWIAPSYKIADIGWRLLTSLAVQIPNTIVRQSDRRVEMSRGGWVQIRSADGEGGLRGEGLDFMVIDECAHVAKFADIWQQELRPALSDRKGGAMFISTPKGYNHFWELFERAKTEQDYAAFQHPSQDNPYLDPAEIESAKREIPALVFRQEYGAEYVQLAGALFRREYFDVVDHAPGLDRIVRFWDLAASEKKMADYTTSALVGMQGEDLYICDMVRGRWDWSDAVKVIGRTAKSDMGVWQYVETAGTQVGMVSLLHAEPLLADLPFTGVTPHKDKITRANPWLARAEQRKVHLVAGAWNKDFLDEVCAFPEAEHDDQVDAVSGAMAALAGGSWFVIGGENNDDDDI